MELLKIQVPQGIKIAVIGDAHGHSEQFLKLIEKIEPSEKMWIVSVGDILDKGFGQAAEDLIIDKMRFFIEAGIGFVVKGNHELRNIREARKKDKMTPNLAWLEKLPLSLLFNFTNQTRLCVIHGGILPSFTLDDLQNNIELCYIRNVFNGKCSVGEKNGENWHKLYDGRFGYCLSGHNSQKDGKPKFYNYSANIDTAVYNTGILTCQIFSENGKEDLIQATGPARFAT
jgi:predicted phosphodiesterase